MSKNAEVANIINIAPLKSYPWTQAALSELQHPDISIPDEATEKNNLVLCLFLTHLVQSLPIEE